MTSKLEEIFKQAVPKVFTADARMAQRLDETDPFVTYIGIADRYVTDNEPRWLIQRITVSGKLTINEFSPENSIYANRAGLTYK